MDDIIDLEIEKIDGILAKIESDPEDEEIKSVERRLWERIRHKTEEGRRTGLGVTGEGDMLAALGMTYGSDESIEFSTQVHKTLAVEAYRSSVNLARERGAFAIYDSAREEDNPFIQRLIEEDPSLGEDMKKYGRRNIALLTIAPTGTVSLMTQTSSGLEQMFLPAYERRRKVNPNDEDVDVDFVDEVGDSWEKYKVFHHKFKTWLQINGYDVEEVKRIANESVRDEEKSRELEEIVKQSPYYRATSKDVDWLAKVRLQGAVQKWVDHSISVTINLPKDTSEDLVDKLYQTAWKEGCKGVTIYRDGSREGVLLTGKEDEKRGLEGKVGTMDSPLKIPGIMPSIKIKQPTPWGNMHVFVVVDPSRNYAPIETFGNLGNAGSVEAADIEMAGRLTSLWLRSGGIPKKITDQLKGIGSGVTSTPSRDGGIQSLAMGFAKAVQRYEIARQMYDVEDIMLGKVNFEEIYGEISDTLRTGKPSNGKEGEDKGDEINTTIKYSGEKCPDCPGSLVMEEGCQNCHNCGYSKC